MPDIEYDDFVKFSFFKLSDFDVYGPVMMDNLRFPKLFTSMEIWMVLSMIVVYLITDRLFKRIDL